MQISFITFNQRFLQCIWGFDSDYVRYIKCTIPVLFFPTATPVCVQQWMQLCVTPFEKFNCGQLSYVMMTVVLFNISCFFLEVFDLLAY